MNKILISSALFIKVKQRPVIFFMSFIWLDWIYYIKKTGFHSQKWIEKEKKEF